MGCSGSSSSDIKSNLNTCRKDKISCNIKNTSKGPIDSNNTNNEKYMNNTKNMINQTSNSNNNLNSANHNLNISRLKDNNNNNDDCINKIQSTNESIINVFYLTYETFKENEKVNLISNKKYYTFDIKGKKTEHNSFYSINKPSLLITIDSSTNITSNEYIFPSIGEHKVKIKIKGNITDLSGMFYLCRNLVKVEGVIGKDIKSFRYMFNECSSLHDIDGLKDWNVSNGNDFSYMFSGCTALENIDALNNLNVSNGNDFSFMFSGCSALENIDALSKWNVSNCYNFHGVFSISL